MLVYTVKIPRVSLIKVIQAEGGNLASKGHLKLNMVQQSELACPEPRSAVVGFLLPAQLHQLI